LHGYKGATGSRWRVRRRISPSPGDDNG
jgi:hypothetical protein